MFGSAIATALSLVLAVSTSDSQIQQPSPQIEGLVRLTDQELELALRDVALEFTEPRTGTFTLYRSDGSYNSGGRARAEGRFVIAHDMVCTTLLEYPNAGKCLIFFRDQAGELFVCEDDANPTARDDLGRARLIPMIGR